MQDETDHAGVVHAWMKRVTDDRPAEALIDAFDEAFNALWRRANQTLGDVTLTAILDRVLHVAAERFPAVASLELDAAGIHSGALRERASSNRDELAEGLRFVLDEFLTVLGNLTAQILTPALHAELSKATSRSEESKP
jgi:hypothetical protein